MGSRANALSQQIRLLLLALLVLLGITTNTTATAEEILSLKAETSDAASLPLPGEKLTVVATLAGTRQPLKEVKGLFTLDGRFIEIHVPQPRLNKRNQLEYQVVVYAPQERLSYQFVGIPKEGEDLILSNKVTLVRPCAYTSELIDITPTTQTQASLSQAVNQAQALERELRNYDQAIDLLDQLAAHIKRRQS